MTEKKQISSFQPPSITLPNGGGAIRGIGEKFANNPVTGTGSITIPIFTSPGRSGFEPQLSLAYDSGNGNDPFGFGCQAKQSERLKKLAVVCWSMGFNSYEVSLAPKN